MIPKSRESMIRSAAALIATRGFNATSLSDVLADSGAPRGSIYHHFPDGKVQLGEEAVRWTGARVLVHLRGSTGPTTPAAVLSDFIDVWRRVVLASQGASGCAVAGVAVDMETSDDRLGGAVRETFRAWAELLAEQLERAGMPERRAASLAVTALAAMEGALILCRAEGNVEPLDVVASELARLAPEKAKY